MNEISNNNNIKNIFKEIFLLSPFFLFFTILTFFVSKNIFFWDTIQLGSAHAQFFYDTKFSSIILPDSIDSGHIPAFGMYLSFVWLMFGKTLFVSHFAMLPFLFGIVWQTNILVKQFIQPKFAYLALILILADPTLLGQSALVSPDICLVFFFLLAINMVLKNKNQNNKSLKIPIKLSIAIIFLFLTSMRGMMVAVAILMFDIVINIKFINIKSTFIQLTKRSLIYLPALFIFVIFNFIHYKSKAWIGYHSDSPWSKSFELVDIVGFAKNAVVLLWRILDFGRIFIALPIIIIFLFITKTKIFKDKNFIKILLMIGFTLFSLSITFLMYHSLNGHRYILPVYLVVALLASYLIVEKIKSIKIKYSIFVIVLFALLTGNLWIYPEKISQGWDSNLAHLHYFEIRNKMINYIEQEEIEISNIGSSFPNLSQQKYLDLSNNTEAFAEKNIETNKYILFSNVYNGFTDKEIDELHNSFLLKKEYSSFGVFMQLYEKK